MTLKRSTNKENNRSTAFAVNDPLSAVITGNEADVSKGGEL
ncbi:hypothetical protein [Tropicibacter sp. R15_0]|nr:hypothetical protein [Tropicibacter sp. R15_0]